MGVGFLLVPEDAVYHTGAGGGGLMAQGQRTLDTKSAHLIQASLEAARAGEAIGTIKTPSPTKRR